MASLARLSEHCRTEIENEVAAAAAALGISMYPRRDGTPEGGGESIDESKVDFHSRLANESGLSLPDFIRLVRGQTTSDPRPNKDLYELPRPKEPKLQEACDRWNAVVRDGVSPQWLPSRPTRQTKRPRNHGSIHQHLDQVRRHIRKGQDDGRYLVVRSSLLELWEEVYISPVGVVEKDGTDIRMIDDYSFPEGESINDFTDRSNFPDITYNPPGDIARRIFTLRRDYPNVRILLMLGDVSGAFRHVPINADDAHMFAFVIGDYLVVDLACGFGWCGSPAWYFLPGTLINGLYEETSCVTLPCHQPLGGLFWVDDHTCIEPDHGLRCFRANLALQRAMATVLGPKAINFRKFTEWSEEGRALGLIWDTRNGTVTIPAEKIAKALTSVNLLLGSESATKTRLLQLLGLLRHVASCCPPARAFDQRIQAASSTVRRHTQLHLSSAVLEDLKWFRYILQHEHRFNGIPVSQFAGDTRPLVHVHMDASNEGLCVLEPTLRQYIRVRFSEKVKMEFALDNAVNSINVRELQSGVLAALIWGPIWSRRFGQRPINVQFWIDNSSAVSWAKRRSSRQPLAQTYNRILSLAEFQFSIICTARHIRGADNTMADAGSRAWSTEHPLYRTWTDLSYEWSQVPVPALYNDLSRFWDFARFMQWSEWLSNDVKDNGMKLGLFAVYCWRRGWRTQPHGNQYSTIQLKLSSIRWYHRRHAGIELKQSADFEVLMRGIRRLSDPLKKKQPITPAFLRLLHRRLDFSRPRSRLLWGSILLAYFFLLRRSEYLRIGSSWHAYCLEASNVYFSSSRGERTSFRSAEAVTLGLTGAKNDQFGRGAWRTMHATGDRVLCPIKALHHVLQARKELRRVDAPYLCVDLSAEEVSRSFKSIASSLGIPPSNYATHSVRIGGATALLSGEADSLSIKLLGRWMSNTYEDYPVLAAESTRGLSLRMI